MHHLQLNMVARHREASSRLKVQVLKKDVLKFQPPSLRRFPYDVKIDMYYNMDYCRRKINMRERAKVVPHWRHHQCRVQHILWGCGANTVVEGCFRFILKIMSHIQYETSTLIVICRSWEPFVVLLLNPTHYAYFCARIKSKLQLVSIWLLVIKSALAS